ncbi:hypothetical protein BKD30_03980 [Tersicoccus phoenicis]|uniref:Uncharacterized protein n=1 Tax=Tersicoccus phoenicis TaxID=554083 RepID=A0A1R1LHR4_9MICC|nr:hypothetical protein BKD30_03980 [Tersicoccus phoenicis]
MSLQEPAVMVLLAGLGAAYRRPSGISTSTALLVVSLSQRGIEVSVALVAVWLLLFRRQVAVAWHVLPVGKTVPAAALSAPTQFRISPRRGAA